MKELLQILTKDSSLRSRGTVFSFCFFLFFNSNSMHIVIALMLFWISLKGYNPRKLS